MSTSSITERKEEEGTRTHRFEEADALDTAQIIAELRGEVSDEYFYTIKDETGKEVAGLSYAGTKWIASQMAVGDNAHPLSIEHIEIPESPDGLTFRAIATVKDLATGEKRPGVYEQNKFRRRNVWDSNHKKIGEEEVLVEMYRDGKPIGKEPQRDPHAYTIASSKATRNGLRSFMPEPVILKLYEQWKTNKAGKKESPATTAKDITKDSQVRDVQKTATLESLRKELEDFPEARLVIVEGGWEVVVADGSTMTPESRTALAGLMRGYGGKASMEGTSVTYRIVAQGAA